VGRKNIPRILVMKKETIIKFINEYFNKIGNKNFVKKYWLDPENTPFKIWIGEIDGDNIYIYTNPEELSHTIENSDGEILNFDYAVIDEVQNVMVTMLDIEPKIVYNSRIGYKYFFNEPPPKKSPYDDKKTNEFTKVRTFDNNVDENELKWHRDKNDRQVKILECNGWMLQLDNELPVIMEEGIEYFIPKEVFHRTIKGTGNLVVEIKELN
jgi:hypothetical protein